MSVVGTLFRWFYEWRAKGKNYADLLKQFDHNEKVVYDRMLNAKESDFNHTRTVHVIGIERWGAHRLRVALGAPLVIDEYDGYAPSDQLTMPQLAEEFKQTRAATLAVVHELQSKGVPLNQTVRHNEAGNLSVGGWLFYLENHIGRETTLLMRAASGDSAQATPSQN